MNNSSIKNTAKATPELRPYVISPELHGALHRLYNALVLLAPAPWRGTVVHATLREVIEQGNSPLARELAALCPPVRSGPRSFLREARAEDFTAAWLIATGHAQAADYDDEDVEIQGVVTCTPVKGGGES